MALDIKDSGKRISSMEKDLRHGQMALVTRVNMLREKNMVRANSHGLMEAHMKESLLRTTLKDRESICGQMEEFTTGNGKIIRWKEEAFSHGLMAGNTKGST